MNVDNYLQLAIDAAKKAGNFLIENKYKEKVVNSDEGRDIKLKIDQDCEQIIKRNLSSSRLSFIGEEYGVDTKYETDFSWVVDPIDGTANYFRGIDQCCTSIALMKGNESYIGVIYNFNTDELYYASKNNGAYLNSKRINVSNINVKNQASLITGFPASESVNSSINFLEDLSQWKKVRMFGSAALSCAYVAAGKCDYYSEKGVYLWDFAAGICLIEEAGGKANYKKIDSERYELKFSNNLL